MAKEIGRKGAKLLRKIIRNCLEQCGYSTNIWRCGQNWLRVAKTQLNYQGAERPALGAPETRADTDPRRRSKKLGSRAMTAKIKTVVQPGHKIEVEVPEMQIGTAVEVSVSPTPASSLVGQRTAEQWIVDWKAWIASHPRPDRFADDSRESIYEGRGE